MFNTTKFQMLEDEEMLRIDGGILVKYPPIPIRPIVLARYIYERFFR